MFHDSIRISPKLTPSMDCQRHNDPTKVGISHFKNANISKVVSDTWRIR